jgi:hypothetical protein
MKRRFSSTLYVGSLCAAAVLAGCSVGGQVTPGSQPAPSAGLARVAANPQAAGRTIYVANTHGDSVTEYAAGADGNVFPLRTIAGAATQLHSPRGVAVDGGGRVYVSSRSDNAINVYPAGADGNVAPIQIIKGAHTKLDEPTGIAVAGNRIYVTNRPSTGDSISVYGAGGNGDVAPLRTIEGANTGLDFPYGILADPSGRITVANIADSVEVFAPGANGNVAPVQTIAGANTLLDSPTGVARDAAGRIYVTNSNYPSVAGRVTVYAAGANGNVAPTQTIEGANTGLAGCRGIALSNGHIYVANGQQQNTSLTVYLSGSHGDAAPLRTIAGANTGLNGPDMILVR